MKKLILPIFSLFVLSGLVLFSAHAETPNIPQNPSLGSSWVRDFVDQNPEYQDMPITERTEKSITFQKADGSFVTQAVDFPIHYKDEKGQWQLLDTTLKFYPETNEWGAPGFETRIKPDGAVTIKGESQTITQRTASYGTLNAETGEFFPLGEFGEGNANGDTLIRYAGEVEHKIKLTDLGIKEEMIVSSAPTGISENDYLVMKTEIGNKQLFLNGWVEDEDLSQFHLPAPFSFDANQKPILTKRYARFIDGKQDIFTGVKASKLSDLQFPITIDPDYLDSTDDGFIQGRDGIYTTARSNSSSFMASSNESLVGQSLWGEPYEFVVERAFFKFDTSTIGAGATVTQVNLKMVCVTDSSSTFDFDVQIVKQDWSAQDPITSGNREAAYDNCLAGTADDNIWRNTLGMSVNTQYSSGNLNTAWVNKTGNTYYSLRSSRDKNGNEPTEVDNTENIRIASQEHSTVAYRPILTVVYIPPPFISLSGVFQFLGTFLFQ